MSAVTLALLAAFVNAGTAVLSKSLASRYPARPIIGVLLLQGISEVVRCCRCIRTGQWPARPHDVEETESAIMHLHEDEARMGRELPHGTDEGSRR